ncbi:MAG: short-chain dehydrogenase [Glaciihabitans sp.]|nr:short-chain dehydrogenase [Glaciihabitans sp.]
MTTVLNPDNHPIAMITGASRGIGLAIAKDLGRTHHVIVMGRDANALRQIVAALPSATAWAVDVADAEALESTFPELATLDVLVHSAGVIDGAEVANTSRATWRKVFDINVFAVADLTRLALPALRAARGSIVAINSGSGYLSNPSGGLYAASKFALRALTDALREEERAAGVRVTSLHPGRVDTDMQQQLVASEGGAYDPQFYLDADTVASTVRFAIEQPVGASVEQLSVRPQFRR